MADIAISTKLCSVHCLHLGVSGQAAGATECCFCGEFFGTPAAGSPNFSAHGTTLSRVQLHNTTQGAFFAAILGNGGKR